MVSEIYYRIRYKVQNLDTWFDWDDIKYPSKPDSSKINKCFRETRVQFIKVTVLEEIVEEI